MTLLKSSGWQKSFLHVADAPLCDFPLYLTCYFTGFTPKRYTGVASFLFPDRGLGQGIHMSQSVLTGTLSYNQAVIINRNRLVLLLRAENYSHGPSLSQFTGRLPLSLTAAQLEQQLMGQSQLLTQQQRGRNSLQGPCFIQCMHNPTVFL